MAIDKRQDEVFGNKHFVFFVCGSFLNKILSQQKNVVRHCVLISLLDRTGKMTIIKINKTYIF